MKTIQLILFVLAMTFTSLIQAQTMPVDDNGLAVGGYDVVAYFSGEAARGFETFKTTHDKATYYFSTKENLEAFQKNPAQYLPQFDGYCAWGVGAKEAKFPINPETFDIVDGKLYLFYNGPFDGSTFNSLQPWNAETTKLLKAAHSSWENVKKKG